MGMKKAKFSKQFKIDAIRIYPSGEHGGYTPVSKFLEITRTNLINWVAPVCQDGRSRFGRWPGQEQYWTVLFAAKD